MQDAKPSTIRRFVDELPVSLKGNGIYYFPRGGVAVFEQLAREGRVM